MDAARVVPQEPAEGGELTAREREILAFERQWWKYAGAKEQAVRELYDLSPTRCYQVLNALLARVIVVSGVIGVAYTLFLKQSNPANTGSQSLPAVTSAPQSASAPAGAAPSSTKSGAASRTTSPSPSASAGTSGTVDKSVSF